MGVCHGLVLFCDHTEKNVRRRIGIVVLLKFMAVIRQGTRGQFVG